MVPILKFWENPGNWKKKEGPEPLFENKIVSKYYDHVDFVQKVKIKDPSKPIKASVYYMSCDSEQCIPPLQRICF